jgi:hypothetical protein
MAVSGPPLPQHVSPAQNPGRRNSIFLHLFEVIQLQMDLSKAIKDYINAFLRSAVSRPHGPRGTGAFSGTSDGGQAAG